MKRDIVILFINYLCKLGSIVFIIVDVGVHDKTLTMHTLSVSLPPWKKSQRARYVIEYWVLTNHSSSSSSSSSYLKKEGVRTTIKQSIVHLYVSYIWHSLSLICKLVISSTARTNLGYYGVLISTVRLDHLKQIWQLRSKFCTIKK